MKTKIITTLICTTFLTSSMAGDNWDIFRKTFYSKDATHEWLNTDGSKTYRYDSPGRTTFENRSPQSVQKESEVTKGLVVLGVAAVIAVIDALMKGGTAAPQYPNYNYSR